MLPQYDLYAILASSIVGIFEVGSSEFNPEIISEIKHTIYEIIETMKKRLVLIFLSQ